MSEARGERRLRRLLDTNVCMHVIRRQPQAVLRRFKDYGIGEVGVSSVTVAELRYGAEKSSRPEQNLEALGRFLLPLEVLAFGGEAAAAYGCVRAALERAGTPIGPLDTLIAAHAVGLSVTFVTNNTREFQRVQGLEVEDWSLSDALRPDPLNARVAAATSEASSAGFEPATF